MNKILKNNIFVSFNRWKVGQLADFVFGLWKKQRNYKIAKFVCYFCCLKFHSIHIFSNWYLFAYCNRVWIPYLHDMKSQVLLVHAGLQNCLKRTLLWMVEQWLKWKKYKIDYIHWLRLLWNMEPYKNCVISRITLIESQDNRGLHVQLISTYYIVFFHLLLDLLLWMCQFYNFQLVHCRIHPNQHFHKYQKIVQPGC